MGRVSIGEDSAAWQEGREEMAKPHCAVLMRPCRVGVPIEAVDGDGVDLALLGVAPAGANR